MADFWAPGNKEALAAIAAISGAPSSEVLARFSSAAGGGEPVTASLEEITEALGDLIRRARLAPISTRVKGPLIESLTALQGAPPSLHRADLVAWRTITRDLPIGIVELDRAPVVLPAMPSEQESAWRAVLDFEENPRRPLVPGRRTDGHAPVRRARSGRPPVH